MIESRIVLEKIMSEIQKKETETQKNIIPEARLVDDSNNLAGWFFNYNKTKGRPICIPKLGISINADGTIEDITTAENHTVE
jgi:hypothetical protein